MAFRPGETFVAVAFCSYGGGFWLSYFFLSYFVAPHLPPSVAGNAVGLYLLGWLIFTFYMTIAALKTNVAVLGVFVTLTATYLLLVLAELGVARPLLPIAGYVGITYGVTAWYVAFAHITNATFGRELFPDLGADLTRVMCALPRGAHRWPAVSGPCWLARVPAAARPGRIGPHAG